MGVRNSMNVAKLTARVAKAAMASGTMTRAVVRGVCTTPAMPAAATPPRTVPEQRSMAFCQALAKKGCMVNTRVMVSQWA